MRMSFRRNPVYLLVLMDFKTGIWNRGISSSTKQDEVINFIATEKLHICAILETHLISNMLDKVCFKIFGQRSWFSNMKYCDKGCRIIVGWNSAHVNIIGDFNVTLHPNEHSTRSSSITIDMMEFNDCINQVEVEDLSSAGFHFTWTKNLHKVKLGDYTGILKKLDRIMVSEEFMGKYPQAHAIFMPYLISDHSPALLIIPNAMRYKKKSFKFANYITEKEGFCRIVEEK
ncbi:RNA-directed DNA polymerase, eukaryota, reverse transcriptase zinc-binding domain protein [Tanacetum coccineum]